MFDKPDNVFPIHAERSVDMSYRQAGVDIEAGEEAVRLIKADAESTYIPGVLGSIGGFAGMFQLPSGLQDPVLVTSTDGVGTKLLLAQETGRLDTVGIDLVAMSVNDVLTVGRPAHPVPRLRRRRPAAARRDGAHRGRRGRRLPPGGVRARRRARWPRCPGSTPRASSTWPASAWVWRSGPS